MDLRPNEEWLDRKPLPGETCVFSHGYWGTRGDSNAKMVADWKRDALLFDRVYAPCLDPDNPPDIPPKLSFGSAAVEGEMQSYDWTMGHMMAQAFPGMSTEEAAALDPNLPEMFDFDLRLSLAYSRVGIMGEWTYSSAGPYFRRFVAGEAIAYEGALNNIPIVSAGNMSWDHVIEFKNDPEAARKYRDLRLWLRSGLNAQSVEHATDIIAQKIEDYRWAIKKHGLQTYSGMITQLFDWKDSRLTLVAAGTAGMFGGPIWAGLASGLAIAAKIGVLLTEKRISSQEIRRGPEREIAILYDIREKFGET